MVQRTLANALARRIFLERHGLSAPPRAKQSSAELLQAIDALGFVQVDSIQTVARAHHMILFARNQTYRRADLAGLLEGERSLFENWTHDAAIIPSRFFPFWREAFAARRLKIAADWRRWGREGFEEQAEAILSEIARRGPCLSREIGTDEKRNSGGWWNWNPSKTCLEYLWRTGRLAVARREGFQKVYDLTENVIPAEHLQPASGRAALVDWACEAALDRLGFATTGELAAFWALISPAEAKDWAERRDLEEVEIEAAEGGPPRRAYAAPDLFARPPAEPPARVRALSPFDPLIRDRKRARRLFGFDYTIEVFVPAAKRKYGYYVFPLLEGARMIGRIDMKAETAADRLVVSALWLEPGVRLSAGRRAAIEAEIERQRRFAGMGATAFAEGWIKS